MKRMKNCTGFLRGLILNCSKQIRIEYKWWSVIVLSLTNVGQERDLPFHQKTKAHVRRYTDSFSLSREGDIMAEQPGSVVIQPVSGFV